MLTSTSARLIETLHAQGRITDVQCALLHRGLRKGKQVVSRAWIDECTAPRIGPADRPSWMATIGGLPVHDRPPRHELDRRKGDGRQRLFAPLNLVAVMTQGPYSKGPQLFMFIFNRHIGSAAEH